MSKTLCSCSSCSTAAMHSTSHVLSVLGVSQPDSPSNGRYTPCETTYLWARFVPERARQAIPMRPMAASITSRGRKAADLTLVRVRPEGVPDHHTTFGSPH